MDNKIKNYLDRVVMELVGSTRIDYPKEEIHLPFFTFHHPPPSSHSHYFHKFPFYPSLIFFEYCKNTFGLTKEEMEYVWEIYKDIIRYKIENGK